MNIEFNTVAPMLNLLHNRTPTSVLRGRELSGIKPSISILIDSLDPSKRKPIKCLGDTGCDLSPIDKLLAKSLGLPILPIASNEPKEFSLANNKCAPRLGQTAILPITVIFLSGESEIQSIEPIKLSFQFEVLEGIHGGKAEDHGILFGKDLIHLVSLELMKRKIDPKNLFNFLVGESPQSLRESISIDCTNPMYSISSDPIRLAKLLVSVDTKLINPGAQDPAISNIIEAEPEPEPDDVIIHQETGDLRPFRSEVFTDEEKEDEYRLHREEILRDPEIVEELRKNALIDSPCTFPGAKISLSLNDSLQNEWWKLSRRQYNTPQAKHQAIKEQIQDWLHRKKIRIAPGGSNNYNINNPLLAVPKVSGGQTIEGQYRICIDPRILNSWLKTDDKFDIPLIRKALEKFSKKRIFGELDLTEAFLQFPLDEESYKLLSFTWENIQYQFICMPFGVKFMTSYCHRIISEIFSNLEFVDPYVDNLPFAAESWEEHRKQLLDIL